MAPNKYVPCEVLGTGNLSQTGCDGIVLVAKCIKELPADLQVLQDALSPFAKVDAKFGDNVSVIPVSLPAEKLIFAPTGPLNRDYDDVRRFEDAALKGVKRALAAGCKTVLLVCAPAVYNDALLVTILGALLALYVPLEIREDVPARKSKASALYVYSNKQEALQPVIKKALAVETGRFVARDIGGSDPERMCPTGVADYVKSVFAGSAVKVNLINGHELFRKQFPLLAAVDRGSNAIERFRGQVIELEYVGGGEVKDTVLLVGKGVTYDTGGSDIKAGGIQAGMHRDKCGAAAVGGFFQTLEALRPSGLRVVGYMGMVRNVCGQNNYVSDELITTRAGVRVRVGNTDAEGRMVMTDLLCKAKEEALKSVNPHLFTVATLTGHAVIACGHYTSLMNNGPAELSGFDVEFNRRSLAWGEPIEVDTIRREDYNFVKGPSEYEDVLQCNNEPSTRTPRGHQFPAAFMITASGLDKHGKDSSQPLKYTHLDIAASSGPFPGIPSGAPIAGLTAMFC